MSAWHYYNPNPTVRISKKTGKPQSWHKGDCVVRAFCGALGKTWDEVFRDLCIIAAKVHDMPNSHKVIDLYAKQNGFYKESLPYYMTVRTFAKSHNGVYIVNVRSHVACVKNNQIHDCWDCGSYNMKTYYTR